MFGYGSGKCAPDLNSTVVTDRIPTVRTAGEVADRLAKALKADIQFIDIEVEELSEEWNFDDVEELALEKAQTHEDGQTKPIDRLAVVCYAKHTKYQPTDEQWQCPLCGADNESFTVEESPDEVADDCELLHEEDEVHCSNCNSSWSGKAVAAVMAKKANLVVCPTCKGAGYVKAAEPPKVSATGGRAASITRSARPQALQLGRRTNRFTFERSV
jgi:Zn finger protein HypA/HybF involved in hydrogenase expression